jgi:hypothetical protein
MERVISQRRVDGAVRVRCFSPGLLVGALVLAATAFGSMPQLALGVIKWWDIDDPVPGPAGSALSGTWGTVRRRIFACAMFLIFTMAQAGSAAVIDATWQLNGNGNWNTPANWDIGVVPNNNATDQYNVRIDNDTPNVTVSLNISPTINNLTIDSGDALTANDGRSLTIVGGSITNNGTLNLQAAFSVADLRISGNTMLSGNGSVILSNNVSNRIYALNAADILTIASGQSITGAGQIGVNLMGLVNQGTINANVGNTLTIDPSSADVTNTGTLQASSGGTLILTDGTFTNSGGVIQSLDGSLVQLRSIDLVGGTLSRTGSGRIAILDGHQVTLTGPITLNAPLEVNGAFATTNLRINGNFTLSGSENVVLSNNLNNRIVGVSATDVLTVSAGRTISGAGNIGADFMGLANLGTINGNVSTPLTIDPSAAGVTNTGTLRASGGGFLQLNGGTFDNTAGTIEALNGSVVYLNGADINGGVFSGTGTGKFFTLNGSASTFRGTITNNTLLDVGSTGGHTYLLIGPTTTLTSSGQMALRDSGRTYVTGTSPESILTNDTNHTIRGGGNLGLDALGLVNKGLIEGTGNSYGLIIDPSSAGVVNEATLRASGGGLLQLNGGTYDNTAGTIEALDGSVVYLNSADITGGVLSGIGTGKFFTLNGSASTFRGTITNNTLLDIGSTGGHTYLRIGPTTTLTGSGQMAMRDSGRTYVLGTSPTSVLTNDTNHTIRGGGNLGLNELGLVNKGLIEGTGNSYGLIIDPSSAGLANQETGVIRALGTAGIQLTSGTFSNQGTVEALNGSFVTYTTTAATTNNVAGVLTGGKWRAISTGGAATITLRGSNITQIAPGTEVVLSGTGSVLRVATVPIDSTLTTNHGSFSILEGRNLTTSSTFSNTGTVTIGTGSTFTAPALTQLTGGQLTAGGWHLGQNATLSVAGPNIATSFGDVTLDNGSTFPQINSLVDNRGTFAIVNGRDFTASGAFDNRGTLNIGTGSTFSAPSGFTQHASATIKGSGTLAVNLQNPGRLAPGNSPGILEIDGDYTQTATGVLEIEVGGLTPGTLHDQVQVAGTATLDGRLEAPLIEVPGEPVYTPQVGQEVIFLTAAGGVTGAFHSTFFSNLPADVAQELEYNTNDVRLKFIAPEPIQFVSADPVATWSSNATWEADGMGAVPESENIISVQNLAGVPQRVDVTTANESAHLLTVGDLSTEIAVAWMA